MAGDEVRIEEQAISNALGAFDTAAEQLQADFQAKAHVALDKFNGANWAGEDKAGDDFRHAIDVGQVKDLLKQPDGQGSQVVDKIVELGKHTRDAINKSLASDQVQATELKKPQGKL
ncbi:MAG TPA: hypothetical protein VGJ59_16845 [Jatrophihabitantaceae bacterium]|jgi:hypothetical protein